MAPFSVVVLINEKSLEVVPSVWICPSKKTSFWPDTTSYSRLKKYLKGESDIKPGSWKKIAVKVVAQADTYAEAKKLKKARQHSATATSVTDNNQPRKNIIISSLESRKQKILPDSPQLQTPTSEESEEEIEIGENFDFNTICQDLFNPGTEISQQGSLSDGEEQNSAEYIDVKQAINVIAVNKEFENKVFQRIDEMKNEIKLLRQQVRQLKSCIITPNQMACPSLAAKLPLPVKDGDDLATVEEFLMNEENRAGMVNYLKKLGGSTTKEVTTVIMRRLFGSEYARMFSLHGKKGKHAFSYLQIYKTALFAILNNSNGTEVEVNKFIGSYLAGAKDRFGGRKLREKHQSKRSLENDQEIVVEILQETESDDMFQNSAFLDPSSDSSARLRDFTSKRTRVMSRTQCSQKRTKEKDDEFVYY